MKLIKALLLSICLTMSAQALADTVQAPAGRPMKADTNHDGSIDKAEAQAVFDKHFDEMDTNHDGKISKEERVVAKAKRQEARAKRQAMKTPPAAPQ